MISIVFVLILFLFFGVYKKLFGFKKKKKYFGVLLGFLVCIRIFSLCLFEEKK